MGRGSTNVVRSRIWWPSCWRDESRGRSERQAGANVPKRGAGATTVGTRRPRANAEGIRFWTRCCDAPEASVTTAQRRHPRVLAVLERASDHARRRRLAVVERSSRRLRDTSPSCARISRSSHRAGSRTSPSSSASARQSDGGRRLPRGDRARVRHGRGGDEGVGVLMTLHTGRAWSSRSSSSSGCEEGVFPHIRSLSDADQLEEERRLATWASRGPTSASSAARVEPESVGRTQYNPPSGSSTRSRTSSCRSSIPAGALPVRIRSFELPLRRGRAPRRLRSEQRSRALTASWIRR